MFISRKSYISAAGMYILAAGMCILAVEMCVLAAEMKFVSGFKYLLQETGLVSDMDIDLFSNKMNYSILRCFGYI